MSRPAPRTDRCLEVKRYPDGRRVTFACDLLAIEPARQLLGYTIRHAATVAGVFLPAGTRSYGCFWAGRPYNLYLWMRRCGARRDGVLGAYFNVCDAVELGTHGAALARSVGRRAGAAGAVSSHPGPRRGAGRPVTAARLST